jgi:hypothetical protein
MKHCFLATFITTILYASACSVSDDERCVDGMYWDDEFKACIIEAEAGADTATTDSEGDTAALGAPCTGPADCQSPPADYCLLDVTHPQNPGMCTIDDCTSGGCPAGNLCCDCSTGMVNPFPSPLCVPTENTSQLTGIQCTCD